MPAVRTIPAGNHPHQPSEAGGHIPALAGTRVTRTGGHKNKPDRADVMRPAGLVKFEAHPEPLREAPEALSIEGRVVNKDVSLAVRFNEAITLLLIEPFYSAFHGLSSAPWHLGHGIESAGQSRDQPVKWGRRVALSIAPPDSHRPVGVSRKKIDLVMNFFHATARSSAKAPTDSHRSSAP
jgi:hypothetical protein